MLSLAKIPQTAVVFAPRAKRLFDEFYVEWEREQRSELYAAAVKRIPVYVRKLGMVYASLEHSLPEITYDQARASIATGKFAAACTRVLIEAKSAQTRPEGEFEERMLAFLKKHDGIRKRDMQQTLSKFAGSCELFNRTVESLVRAELIRVETTPNKGKRVFLER